MNETSGGNVGYYTLDIPHPKRFDPCTVECEDVIAALGLNFFEGEAFKAIWRKGAQRTFGVGKAGNTALRDAEKMAHYGARELAHEQQRAKVGSITYSVEQVLGEKRPVPMGAPWMPYTGGPVPSDEWVEITTAVGEVVAGPPGQFVWGGHGTKGRITHYRPAVKP